LPEIESVAADSVATQKGLRTGMEIVEINGRNVASPDQAASAPPATGCCAADVKVTSRELAANAVLSIDKLTLKLSGSEAAYWTIDDPPEREIHGDGPLQIFGLEIAGDDDQEAVISHVRRQSPEAYAGLHAGQRVESLSGREVRTIGELRKLLDEHRQQPWIRIHPAHGEEIDLAVERPLPRTPAVHPTQLYSTIDALVLCLLLLAWDRFRRRDGALTALMMTVYPITRFLIETIRTDEQNIWGTGLHISQNISLGILAAAVCLWIYILRRPAKLAFGGR
jgi:hypothetical protein